LSTKKKTRFVIPTKEHKLEYHRVSLSKIGVHYYGDNPDLPTVHIYTDGSFDPASPLTMASPGGWGFCVQQDEDQWIDSFGMVITEPDNPAAIGILEASNNTAEIQAIIEALDYILCGPANVSYVIHTDSQYALDLVNSLSKPTTHFGLVIQLQALARTVRLRQPISFVKVAAHVGIPGNERADLLATKGRLGRAQPRVGRFITNPPTALHRPEVFQVPAWFSELSFVDKYVFLKDLFSLAKDVFPVTKLKSI
jgi:ribonuclease HI